MEEKQNMAIPQELIYKSLEEKNKEISSKRSIVSYIGIVLINICLLVVFWILISNKYGVASSREVFESFEVWYLVLICLAVVGVILLQALTDYISLFKRDKKHRFCGVLFANCERIMYGNLTVYSKGGDGKFVERLGKSRVSPRSSVSLLYLKKFFELVSLIIYSIVTLVVGTILFLQDTNIIVLCIGLVSFVVNCGILCFVLYSAGHIEKSVELIAKLSKILFKLKLIRDIDKFFREATNAIYVYGSVIKPLSKVSWLGGILANIGVRFLRHLVLFVIFQMFNFGGSGVLVEVVFASTIFDLIVIVLPLQRGTLVFEILFATLFFHIFFDGYLPWVMIAFRLFDYFVYILIPLIVKIFDFRGRKGVAKECGEVE